MFVIWALVSIAIPVLIIYFIARALAGAFGRDRGSEKHKRLSDRDFIIGFLAVPAVVAGLSSVNMLADAIGPMESEEDAISFMVKIVSGIVLLIGGLMLSGITGRILMITAIGIFIFAAPFVFDSFGDSGVFLVLLLAFTALIYYVVRINRHQGGASGQTRLDD